MRACFALVLAAGLSAATAAGAQGVTMPKRATLTVKGTASLDRSPDVARLAVTVRTRGPTLDGTVHDHEARVAQAGAALGRLKAAGVTVDAGAFSVNEERAPPQPGVKPGDVAPTFRAETRYDLSMPLGAKLDATVAEIASTGLFELGQARFSLSDGASAIDAVRRAAAMDAKRQAQIYADAFGVRLDSIDRITDGAADGEGDVAVDLPVRRFAMAAPASVGIRAPKSLSFTGSVTVVWHIVSH